MAVSVGVGVKVCECASAVSLHASTIYIRQFAEWLSASYDQLVWGWSQSWPVGSEALLFDVIRGTIEAFVRREGGRQGRGISRRCDSGGGGAAGRHE